MVKRYPAFISAGLALYVLPFASAQIATQTAQSWDPVRLRGYGEVSADRHLSADGALLSIRCESESAARLLQAKYLSDLAVLPGTTASEIKIGSAKLNIVEARGQGLLAALRTGDRVHLAAALDVTSLARLLKNHDLDGSPSLSSTAETQVPMWLDRWDRHGFRFYYRPLETPGNAPASSHNFLKEFDFAQRNLGSGFVFWDSFDSIDTAEGLTLRPSWDWAFEQAKARDLPVGINITINNRGASWFYNQHRDALAQKAPQFSGSLRRIADPTNQANGSLSWSATDAKDEALGWLQESLRVILKDSHNITSILEPHDELRHGAHDILMEHGPVADETWRKFLARKYTSIQNLNSAWGTAHKSWNDVRAPEAAEFAGWDGGREALDLSGEWRVGQEEFAEGTNPSLRELRRLKKEALPVKPYPAEWTSPGFDDSSWPALRAPGNDAFMFLPMRPAIFRRTFQADAAWLARHPRLWLYVWDLNEATGERFIAWLNGTKIGEDTLPANTPHWGAYEVTDALKSGDNQLSLRLPRSLLAYRIYLSPVPPRHYPDLGRELNTRWVDFIDWNTWTRSESVRRGMEAIRQVEPNVQIDLMAPDYYVDEIRRHAVAYGGNFKNTGHMGAFWADFLPSIMRSARLPFSVEPGWPAPDLTWLKKQIGLWSTEGIQGIDYFIHVGRIMWKDDLKSYFEDNIRQVRLIGKYHAPQAEVAALYPSGITAKTGYPWLLDANTNLESGYWRWNLRANLMGLYESDGLTESSFADGDAARYKVVFDSNTSIMDDKLLAEIERYVRDGGTFVTYAQTGRHSPVAKDAWPISALTGYEVTGFDKVDDKGRLNTTRKLKPAAGQDVFSGNWSAVRANGLTLKSIAPDTRDLMLWEDGSVAIGLRPLGKGWIIQIGSKFTTDKIPDRLNAWPDVTQLKPAPSNGNEALTHLLHGILRWRGIATIPSRIAPANGNLRLRHFVSNNGLHDVWAVWNQSETATASGHLVFGDNPAAFPAFARNIRDDRDEPVTAKGLAFEIPPLELRTWITPRSTAADTSALLHASSRWFELQRDWWRASQPVSSPIAVPQRRQSIDLREDWALRITAKAPSAEDLRAWTSPTHDDSAWERVRFGILTAPGREPVHHAVIRKTFTVPADWATGTPTLWMQSWQEPTFLDEARVWLDGNLIRDWSSDGLDDIAPPEGFKPGTRHVIAVEIRSKGSIAGATTNVWLWNWPKPLASQDLSGLWQPSQDMLRYTAPVTLPGNYSAYGLRRTVTIPAEHAGRQVYVDAITEGRIIGVLVNGSFVRRFYHGVDEHMNLNITPWVKFGSDNEIQLVSIWNSPTTGRIKSVRLDFHDTDN